MTVLNSIEDVRLALAGWNNVGLVPTMGALHEGHCELLRQCVAKCNTSVISIFVNPTQFGPGEDFERYPRTLDSDLQKAEGIGVQFAFVPSVEEIYSGNRTHVHVSGVTDRWEGAIRPGHFDGVATIVLKLLNIIAPNVAFFGLKDLQQCAVVQRLVSDLNVNTRLEFVETVREPSGLALSSRNEFLSAKSRTHASLLYNSLRLCVDQILTKEVSVEKALSDAKQSLEIGGFEVDYIALVDPISMTELLSPTSTARLVAAAKYEGVRLLDNIPLIKN